MHTPNQTTGFVLLSGGIDSTTCLRAAIRNHGHNHVQAFGIDYGQRHLKETRAAQAICRQLDIPYQVLKLPGMPKVMLTDTEQTVPNISYKDIQGVSPMYVPFRNGQMLSLLAGFATHFCEHDECLGEIYIGAHAEDAANDAYPDCRLDFIGAMGAAIWIGTYGRIRVRAPLIEMYKSEIIQFGTSLGTPYELTWSCYKGEDKQCGVCATCRARREGFEQAGIADPTDYAANP